MESTEAPVWAERFWAKVRKNETTGCHEWTGRPANVGYGRLSVGGQYQYAHRLAWELAHGPIPDGVLIDHLCHNKICVNAAHLRLATKKLNAENLGGLVERNTSGYRGVSYCKATGRWRAQIMHYKKAVNLGRYDTPEEAAKVAERARSSIFTPIPRIA